jgi:transposase
MKKTDARKLGKEVQQELRNQVIRLKKEGRKNEDIAKIVGVSTNHVSLIWQRFKKGGKAAIQVKVRGRREGEKRTLDHEQERWVRRALTDKMPDQMKLPFALWTREAVRQLIKSQYGIVMPIRTVGEYLKRWGFTVRKPVRLAYEQNPVAVNRWLKEEYPAIAAKAKQEKAEIYWGDETGLQTTAWMARGFAPRGKKTVIRISAKRANIGMISAINNEGHMRFMMYQRGITAKLMIGFMNRLIRDARRKVFLIVDNLRVHHSKDVAKWVKAHEHEIELYHLPSYSPELNPDEYLNNDLKTKVHSGLPSRSEKDLTRKTISHMRSIAKKPNRIKNYFKHPAVAYAS